MSYYPYAGHHGCFPQHCCEDSCHHHSYCPFPQWKHPLLCNPAHYCCADNQSDNGPTLVLHAILLEPCGNQSCAPRNLTFRITGPSYPCGETFTLRAGSCTEIDEPLVITGLTPGQYEIDLITSCCSEYDTSFTGPISGGCISITASRVPTVITLVARKRFTRRCRRCGCGNNCGCHSDCYNYNGSNYNGCNYNGYNYNRYNYNGYNYNSCNRSC